MVQKTKNYRGPQGESAEDERPRILVLDDSPKFLRTLERQLGRHYAITSTGEPEEAIRLVLQRRFALVVLDRLLPNGVKGEMVLTRMRDAVPALRAIMVTGHPHYSSAMDAAKRGAEDYASKHPPGELKSKIKAILETKQQVFLSYDRRDCVKVAHLYRKLKESGFDPWMDTKRVVPGQVWRSELGTAINKADRFIFCLSKRSIYKEGVLRDELNHAMKRQESLPPGDIFLIVGRLENVSVPEPFSQFHYVDLFHRRHGFRDLLMALSIPNSKP